jgi:6-phosphogluconolactonase
MTHQIRALSTRPLFIGTYTERLPHVNGKGAGIYRAAFDATSGAARDAILAAPAGNPSFLSVMGSTLVAVGEEDKFVHNDGSILASSGAVCAFAIERGGHLRLVDRAPSLGSWPCHCVVDSRRRVALVSNYGGGSVAALPLLRSNDSSDDDVVGLGAASVVVHEAGSTVATGAVDVARQEAAHCHQISLTRDERFAIVCDLGRNEVASYALDERAPLLRRIGTARSAPGAGPRHAVLAHSQRWLFVVNELDSTIATYAFDAATGALAHAPHGDVVSTLPSAFHQRSSTLSSSSSSKSNLCADIRLHPSGRWLYCSNRGHDSIAVFAVDETSDAAACRLSALAHTGSGGACPRAFIVTDDGRFLLVANQDSDSVVTFAVDATSGLLTPTGDVLHVPTPVCLAFGPMNQQ